ncbi:response regulator [Eleftheria terrae]|uniref:response regulator n=1 Tax=Eleftheria terrae TaxID=1597781 RepID=UPI00263BD3B5|nr:response regulator [Eleftheria terrae]WKB55429.1 response regulator [Eleftheria terrae]
MEFSELFTQSAREVLPLARAKGLVSYFDYRGPYVEMPGGDAGTRAGIHRILLGMTDCLEAGFVMFSAEVEPPIAGVSEVVIHAAGTGVKATAEAVAQVLQRLQLHPLPTPGDRTSRATGSCPASAGTVEFVDAGHEGQVITLRTRFAAIEVPGAEPLPDAAGALAWLVSPVPGSMDSVGRRLHRLGWRMQSFRSLQEARALVHAPEDGGQRLPMLLLVSEFSELDLAHMEPMAAAVPSMWTVLAVLAGSPTVQARGATPVDIRLLPLSPQELERFTAHVDRRTSTTESRETSPSPLYTPYSGLVLVVDDSMVNQLVARGQLEALGYEVAVVSNGADALAFCSQQPPDMILMDIDMPVMGGLEATERLRASQEIGTLPPFPIVAATADDSQLRRHDCLTVGMDGCLAKPIDLFALADEIHRVLPTRPMGPG